MLQKCSLWNVFKVFCEEPLSIHFIKSISKRIGLAHTSVRKLVDDLLRMNLIQKKKAKPFDGFVANRDNDDFIFYKRVYNLFSLKEISDFIVSNLFPELVVVFGSYSRGEDVESSDIDILVVSRSFRDLDLEKFEKKLKRKIHLLLLKDFKLLDSGLRKKVYNGFLLYGGF